MTLEFLYGDGVGGRHHYMRLDGVNYPLDDGCTQGTPDDQHAARKKANEVLKNAVADLPTLIRLQQLTLFLKFKWDGTL
jgi:hypothetical protein